MNPRPTRRVARRLLATLPLALVMGLSGCAGASQAPSVVMVAPITPAPIGVRDTAYDPIRPAPPLRLIDQDGKGFDLATLGGAPAFVYFGYTHCPDVCPTTLADLRAAVAAAGRRRRSCS